MDPSSAGQPLLDGRASATHHVRAPLPSALPLASLVNAPLTLDHTFYLVPRNPIKGMFHPMAVTRSGLCTWMPSLVSMGQPGRWLPILGSGDPAPFTTYTHPLPPSRVMGSMS